MSLTKAGTYRATIKDYGYGAQREGKADFAFVQFAFQAPQIDEATGQESQPIDSTMTWYGYLKSEKSIEITRETLCNVMGMQGTPQALEAFHNGAGSGAINEQIAYDLEIENETYDGKTRSKIKYVNKPGESRTVQKLAAQDVKGFVAGIAGHFMQGNAQQAQQPPQGQYQQPPQGSAPQPRQIPPMQQQNGAPLPNFAPNAGTPPPQGGFNPNEKIPF